MPDPDLVSGPSAAPVGVIERAIGSVEIDAFVARPALLTRAQQAVTRTQTRQQWLQGVCCEQILAIDALLKRPRFDQRGRCDIEAPQEVEIHRA